MHSEYFVQNLLLSQAEIDFRTGNSLSQASLSSSASSSSAGQFAYCHTTQEYILANDNESNRFQVGSDWILEIQKKKKKKKEKEKESAFKSNPIRFQVGFNLLFKKQNYFKSVSIFY